MILQRGWGGPRVGGQGIEMMNISSWEYVIPSSHIRWFVHALRPPPINTLPKLPLEGNTAYTISPTWLLVTFLMVVMWKGTTIP